MFVPQVIVVGEAGCGKTTCINTVSQAHRVMGTPVNTETVVTHALKTADLFGSYSDSSRYGLFSGNVLRESSPSFEHQSYT